jgi:hypothetical protein
MKLSRHRNPCRHHKTWQAAVAVAALALSSCVARQAVRAQAAAAKAHKLCDLADARISESSGLGASRRWANCLYTHNDSGDGARLFLISKKGATRAVITLRDTRVIDCEDMAVAGGNAHGGPGQIYLGDIGDNLKSRPYITVYRLAEAALPPLPAQGEAAVFATPQRLDLHYPDGPHDAETLIATRAGRLLIVTKDRGGSLLFMTPLNFGDSVAAAAKTSLTLLKLGEIRLGATGWPTKLVTGGDLSPDGLSLTLRTYTDAYTWQLPAPDAIDASWWLLPPHKFGLPPTRQGEAICYGAGGHHLFFTSEKLPTPLYEMTP